MKKTYDFTSGTIAEDLSYCYVPKRKYYETFHAANGGIESTPRADDETGGFAALLPDMSFETGSRIHCECTFTGLGAPMLVFGHGTKEEDGHRIFERRLEIVAHKMGCNVWDVLPTLADGTNPPSKKIAYLEFPVEDETKIALTAEIRKKDIRVTMNGHIFGFARDVLPETFVGGIMACEGLCRFYFMECETEEA